MVFVDGVPQRQVASRAAVTEGTFHVDDGGDRLYLGTDPAGHSVRASTLSIGLTVYGAGSMVRGIGVQRYATPVPDKGALRALAPDVTLENVVVRDNATQGLYVGGQNLGIGNTLRATGNNTAGRDPRQAFPDPTVTWLLGPVTLGNDVAHPRRSASWSTATSGAGRAPRLPRCWPRGRPVPAAPGRTRPSPR
jgi:hypothetical protein